jgi:hypothetical protein
MTPMEKRIEDVKQAAGHVHVLHKVKGAVLVYFIENDACPFGYSLSNGADKVITPKVLAGKLREAADLIERGVTMAPAVVKLS